MKAEYFLSIVESDMTPEVELRRLGMDDNDVRMVQMAFVARRRNVHAAFDVTELERMVTEYDCTNLAIGSVLFRERIVPMAQGLCFGSFEADPFVIVPDGRIAMVDHAVRDAAPEFCAADSERFLEALATSITIGLEMELWKGRYLNAVARCAEAAGGQEYFKFGRMICPNPDSPPVPNPLDLKP
jgi:hypothetical protein